MDYIDRKYALTEQVMKEARKYQELRNHAVRLLPTAQEPQEPPDGSTSGAARYSNTAQHKGATPWNLPIPMLSLR